MIKLNLPEFQFRFKNSANKTYIFDEIRKKFVLVTPEEWVRQNFIQFLIQVKNYPPSLMAVEKKVDINNQPQRFDLLVYSRKGKPWLMAEFKSPEIKISQQAFDQVVRYNMALKADFVLVSNGLQHYFCQMNYEKNNYTYLKEVPDFKNNNP